MTFKIQFNWATTSLVNLEDMRLVMDKHRRFELENKPDAKLTEEEMSEGFHFCHDFDGLVVVPNDYEDNFCTCFDGQERIAKSLKSEMSETDEEPIM